MFDKKDFFYAKSKKKRNAQTAHSALAPRCFLSFFDTMGKQLIRANAKTFSFYFIVFTVL